jgi:hypothetical protein
MKVSKNKLQEMITLYLNDVDDYGTHEEYMIAESALSPYKQLLTENKKPFNQLIQEITDKAKTNSTLFDFLTYIKES